MFSGSQHDVVSGLIAMLKDPKASIAMLEKIRKQTEELDEATQRNNGALQELSAKQVELDALEKDLHKKAAGLDAKQESLTRMEEQIQEKLRTANEVNSNAERKILAIEKDRSEIAHEKDDLKLLMISLDERGVRLNEREQVLVMKELEVAAQKNELQAKLAQLKSIAL